MADRVSASIVIGGSLSTPAFAKLAELIASEGLAIEWDGEAFEPEHRTIGAPLGLFAHEVAGGSFDGLETWCAEHRLSFVRWCGGYSGQWGAQRIVSTADGAWTAYATTDDDDVMMSREVAVELGSIEAILAYFEAAEFSVPPLTVDGDPPPSAPAIGTSPTSQTKGCSHVE